jgi:predicted metal-dependent HD superfamily phosphohydrolase
LESLWDNAIRVLGGVPRPTDLCERYTEPHRGYHNADHVRQVARDAEALAADHDERDRALVTLAALAHDIVYDGKPGDDERRSAEWVRDQLAATGVPDGDIRRVERMVLATLTHEAADGDRLTAVLLDADLAILGSDPPAYERYRAAVRAEYAHVDEAAWRVGRTAVLRSLLDRDQLYLTAAARDRWTAMARANMAAEVAALS